MFFLTLCYAMLLGNVDNNQSASSLSPVPNALDLAKRTENEWICPRCRKPAEGHYCSRCGQPYEKPKKGRSLQRTSAPINRQSSV
jgi:predicted amidophosphoribosyltransferase